MFRGKAPCAFRVLKDKIAELYVLIIRSQAGSSPLAAFFVLIFRLLVQNEECAVIALSSVCFVQIFCNFSRSGSFYDGRAALYR